MATIFIYVKPNYKIKIIYNNQFVEVLDFRERLQNEKAVKKLILCGDEIRERKSINEIFGSIIYCRTTIKVVKVLFKGSRLPMLHFEKHKMFHFIPEFEYKLRKALTCRTPLVKQLVKANTQSIQDGVNCIRMYEPVNLDTLRSLLPYVDTLKLDMNDEGATLEQLEEIFDLVFKSPVTTFIFSFIENRVCAKYYFNNEMSKILNKFLQKEDLIILVTDSCGTDYGKKEFYDILENNYKIKYIDLSGLTLPKHIEKRNKRVEYESRFKRTKVAI